MKTIVLIKNTTGMSADTYQLMLNEIKMMVNQNRPLDRIAIRLVGGIRRLVRVSELVYFEANREVTKVVLASGETLMAAVNIGHFTQMLRPDYGFLLIHQSQLVNAEFVHQFNPRTGVVDLTTGIPLSASQRGMAEVKAYFQAT